MKKIYILLILICSSIIIVGSIILINNKEHYITKLNLTEQVNQYYSR